MVTMSRYKDPKVSEKERKRAEFTFKYFVGPFFISSVVMGLIAIPLIPIVATVHLGNLVLQNMQTEQVELDRTETHYGPGF